MVQVVTGDSQEEVIIFRYRQTDLLRKCSFFVTNTQTLHHNIYIITIIIIIIAIQHLRRGSAAGVRPSEENVASSSQLPRAGWQVKGIYKIFFNIKNIVNMFMNFSGRLLCPVPPTAPRRKNFPRDEWSSLEEWAQAVL